MRWPWQRAEHNGHAAEVAKNEAQAQLQRAHDGTERVDEAARRARELTKRVNRFAADVERSMRPRGL